MFATLLRVLFGFLAACLVAGLIKVGFVMPPTEVLALPENVMYDRLGDGGLLTLVAATQSAVFAAPFALVAAAIAEWQSFRNVFFYALIGLAISVGGFIAIYASEMQSQPSIVNGYAMTAYGLSGILAGVVYWAIAGRLAGEDNEEEVLIPATAPPPPPRITRPAAVVPPARSVPTPPAPPPTPPAGAPPRKT
jgi:hypothetical protein